MSLLAWSAGDVGVGVLLGAHFHLSPQLPADASEISRFRGSFRTSLTLGHTFYLFDRQLSVATHVFLGPSVHVVEESLRNEAYGIDRSRGAAAIFAEVGWFASIAYRFDGEPFGISLDALMPLYVVGKLNILDGWFVSPPFLGVSFNYFTDP